MGSGPSDDWCYHTADQTRAPTCPSFAFARVDLTSLGRLDDLGLVAVVPGRADCRPRLHGQHRQTSWCLLAHGQYLRPGCRGRAARTRPAMRWEGVRVVGVDGHVWQRGGGDRFVTVTVDPAPVRERRGPSRARGILHRAAASRRAQRGWRGRLSSARAGARSGGDGRDRPGTQERSRRRTTGQHSRDGPSTPAHLAAQALEERRQRAHQQNRGRMGRAGTPLV